MNKKGFTLVELLAVIAILGLIIAIAFPSIGNVTQGVKDKMLETKATMIEDCAILYGQDIKGSIMSSDKRYDNNPCEVIKVKSLVPSYLDNDTNKTCLNDDLTGSGCVVDPSKNDEYLDNKNIIIYFKNKRIKATLDVDGSLTCS